MAMRNIDEFKGYGSGSVNGVHVATGRAETRMATERKKLEVTARRTSVQGATKRRITTVEHFVNIFDNRISGVKNI